jgi:hypothetical protein
MGTRNLTAVMIDGEYKIAQYGQWDGYPSGQGVTALEFLRETDLDKFKEACRNTRFLTEKECDEIDEKYGTEWKKHYPQLSRDNGADILGIVFSGVTELQNKIGFAGDSLFCEYAYVVDLDAGTFEIYEGFNKDPITEGRFVSGAPELEKSGEYEPVKLIKTYQLNDLPNKDDFLADLEPDDEDEDAA